MKRALAHLRANAIAYLALFFALGSSGALAATQLGKNSVGTAQLKKNAVVSSKVKNGSLRARDFAKGQLPTGTRGLQGEAGPPGRSGGAVRAYAYVNGGLSPSLKAQQTQGFTAVDHIRSGTYCLTLEAGIDLAETAPVITPVYNSGLLEPEFAQSTLNTECSSSQLEVVTYTPDFGTSAIRMTDAMDFTVVLP